MARRIGLVMIDWHPAQAWTCLPQVAFELFKIVSPKYLNCSRSPVFPWPSAIRFMMVVIDPSPTRPGSTLPQGFLLNRLPDKPNQIDHIDIRVLTTNAIPSDEGLTVSPYRIQWKTHPGRACLSPPASLGYRLPSPELLKRMSV